jgi:dTDP-4-dehydrorhamnose reductase
MKVLLLGRGGQVGWELQRSLGVLGEVVALDFDASQNPQGLCGDFTDIEGLERTVEAVQPDVIVNAAAHTAVDKAESESELARTINALAPAALARAAIKTGAWLVHYSTDYVFDGSGNAPWKETDATGPLSVYGQTKLEGEQAVATCPKHLILRTSWVYAELLADVTAHAIRTLQTNPELAGLYHCIAAGETTWHGYAQFVLEQATALGLPLKATADKVAPTPTSSYPTPAKRPLNSRLDTTQLQAAFGLRLPHWQHGVKRMLIEIAGK